LLAHQSLPLVYAIPTPVGVNRVNVPVSGRDLRYPHARGGEPVYLQGNTLRPDAIPTPVGVNRSAASCSAYSVQLSPRPWG